VKSEDEENRTKQGVMEKGGVFITVAMTYLKMRRIGLSKGWWKRVGESPLGGIGNLHLLLLYPLSSR
jgi:hypothetical protein